MVDSPWHTSHCEDIANEHADACRMVASDGQEHELPAAQETQVPACADDIVQLETQAKKFAESVGNRNRTSAGGSLIEKVLGDGLFTDEASEGPRRHGRKLKGALTGVFLPTCENMWGVLIFLRFHWIVGQAGVGFALLAVCLSFTAAFCTASSMAAIASSGGLVSQGGPYYMMSRALGPVVGASIGIMKWLAITLLAVLETLGAVEAFLLAVPSLEFNFCKQAYGSIVMFVLALFVWGGIGFVTKLGIVLAIVVFLTIATFYAGLIMAPATQVAKTIPWITGLSFHTLSSNWGPHYDPGVDFGRVLGVFYPCFTGILSGANRAEILRDPAKNMKDGTFGAIVFSLLMYSSLFILWGMVADYRYLKGETYPGASGAGADVVTTIVYNPFPLAANVGIIIASISQSLQCLIVAPRLLQSIARDNILDFLSPLAPLSSRGEPRRALACTYAFAGLLVMIGEVDAVAPLLTVCFLVAYSVMNISCFALTWLRSTGFRPAGVHKKRWRLWYMSTGIIGTIVCVAIMFIVRWIWALIALATALVLYVYINWKLKEHEWGSALDGLRFQLALKSLIQLENSGSQNYGVNWRPQFLILYQVHLHEELQGIKHHEILRFSAQLRKSRGFCVVACVLESATKDEQALDKAAIDKSVIKSIMKEEGIQGFADVVVAPSWAEGANYCIQLSGLGGMAPNTVLLDWPLGWEKEKSKAYDFVNVFSTALAANKAVLAVKGLWDMPSSAVHGTIDVWWMIHDGGFMVVLSWLLVQHRVWRQCHIRIFTITEGVSEERAKKAARRLTQTLREQRLFDVDVEVILADDEMIEPYTYDWTLRVEERQKFLNELKKQRSGRNVQGESMPLEIDELFNMEEGNVETQTRNHEGSSTPCRYEEEGVVAVSDLRQVGGADTEANLDCCHLPRLQRLKSHMHGLPVATCASKPRCTEVESFARMNQIIFQRSRRAQLVVMNLPHLWATDPAEVDKYMQYCDSLTTGLERVLFVHSSGEQVFNIA